MSTESEPVGITPEDDPAQSEPPAPEEETPPPVDEPPSLPAPEPPPSPDLPDEPLVFEPATWYSMETVCVTADTGNGQPCPNLNKTFPNPFVYSNAGTPYIVCGLCGQDMPILSATKLDPQPEMT